MEDRKIYKNSECNICGELADVLKWKQSPVTEELKIFCRECYKKEYNKSKEGGRSA